MPLPPRHKDTAIVLVGPEGLSLADAAGGFGALAAEQCEAALYQAAAIGFVPGVELADLPNRLRNNLAAALAWLPCYFAPARGWRPAAGAPLSARFTPQDRVLVAAPLRQTDPAQQIAALPDSPRALAELIRADLAREAARLPRAHAKARHTTQVAALIPALRRSAEKPHHGFSRANLLELGCGTGTHAALAGPVMAYHGTDSSAEAIRTARKLTPEGRFSPLSRLARAGFPLMNTVLIVDRLRYLSPEARRDHLCAAGALANGTVRVILIDDLIADDPPEPGTTPLALGTLLDLMATCFGGSCTLRGLTLLGYKPHDYLQRAALIELDVMR